MKRYLLVVSPTIGPQVLGPFTTDRARLEVVRQWHHFDRAAKYLRLNVREGRRPVVSPFSGKELR